MTRLRHLVSRRPLQILLFLFGIFCLSLVALQPFTLNQMPETADGLLHLYRTAAVDYSLKVENPLWSRYTTSVVYGYGAPLFNYFPPLSYYPGSWLHTLGLTFVQSWLAMVMLYTIISATGMFFLGRIWTQSNVGGWVTAAAYIYAPYFLFDSVARGTSSEMGALAVLPFVYYGFTRLVLYGRRTDFLFTVIAFALFIPMHTLLTLHGTFILGLYCLFLLFTSHEKKATFIRLLLAGGLALLITSFFWLPAIVETDAVKINLIADQLDQIDVTQHLRPLGEILALPHTADPTQLGQPIPITLSVVQLILSAFGLIIAWNDRTTLFRNLLLTLWAILLVLIFMNTPTSSWLWENLPLIGYTQFPWRILSMASLLLALMTGISVWLSWSIIPSGWIKTAVFSVLTLIVVSYSIPWAYSLYLGDIELNDIRDVHQFERDTGQLTVSSYSEYLPVSTDERQLGANRLVERFENRDVIPRLLETDGVEIVSEVWHPTSATLQLNVAQSQTLVFDWLYWDGWTAEVNGDSVEVNPSPIGLVTVEVPAGNFELWISLQATVIQSVSVILSILGIGGVLIGALIWKHVAGFSNLHQFEIDPEIQIYVMVVAIGLSVFLFKAIILDHSDTQFKTTRFGDLASENAEIVPLANFGNQIDLLDVELPGGRNSSRFVEIKLYWKLHEDPIDRDYSSIVRMRDPQGIVIAESDSFQPGGIATSNWFANHYVEDVITLEIPQFTPPLLDDDDHFYTFDVSLYDSETLEALDVINASGNPEDVKFELGLYDYSWSRRGVSQEREQKIGALTDASDIVGLYLPVGLPQFPDTMGVGDELIFDWTWQRTLERDQPFNDDFHAQLVWMGDTGVFHSDVIPLIIGYPAEYWQRGEVLTGHHRLIVPADIPAGDYEMGIQLFDENIVEVGDPIKINRQMTITEPDRILERPESDVQEVHAWPNGLVMLGYTMDTVGRIRIVWITDEIQNMSLHLFVHILDENDTIVGQSDGIPVDWTRPTSSWIPDEYVITEHQFDLPAGDYRVRVGWYYPISGVNVAVEDGEFVILDELLKVN